MALAWRVGLVLCVLLVADCAGGPSSTATMTDGTPTTILTTAPIPTDNSTPTNETPTTGDPAYGTEFVSVSKLENGSRAETWPDNKTARFENLSEPRKEVFRDALDGRVTFGPDEENPFAFSDSDRPELVRYEGEWYFVRVAIV
ncbi:hypothetical protein BN996_02636 [Haloferax massiliensis]|uniref:DUF7979 domain-containing protein n=2 Tax=Haloferacaceae TaxID=1644056 RepID=A0A0D6JU21_9EURY|nr:hypothetical protein [Haloferax sp. S2CR25]MDS0445008.1 hypothetical protein [Haloferax sp. S2CR25-2]CQR51229.1 hypothetical protein BN996_02636 [Haloferax massiliensis]